MLAIPLVSNSTQLLACVPISETKSLVYRLHVTPDRRLFDISSLKSRQLVAEFPHVLRGTQASTMFYFYFPTLFCTSFHLTQDEFQRLLNENGFSVTST